jgi:hypothetical protein
MGLWLVIQTSRKLLGDDGHIRRRATSRWTFNFNRKCHLEMLRGDIILLVSPSASAAVAINEMVRTTYQNF